MDTKVRWVFPYTAEGVGRAHQYQGEGTNDCGPTCLAMVINLLAWQRGFITEPHAVTQTLLAAAMQHTSGWMGLGGYRVAWDVFGFPTKGATFARWGMVRAFNALNRHWQALGYASLGRVSFRGRGRKAHLIDNIARNRLTTVRWVWENPYKNGTHWVNVVGYDAEADAFLVLNPALPHNAATPAQNIQRVPWQVFHNWWHRPFFCSRNQMLTFGVAS